jgi:hypothetical protein
MKKLLIISLCLIVSLSACNKAEQTGAETTRATRPETTTAATTTAATTTAATTTAAAKAETEAPASEETAGGEIFPIVVSQVYEDIAMIEYLELSADFETFTPGMIEMNDAIYDEVAARINRYEELLEESGNNTDNYIGGINVWGYSINDGNYIQIHNTVFEYPTYGTVGDLFGFVYDVKEDNYVTLDEFTETIGTTIDDLRNEISEIYASINPSNAIEDINIKTFNLMKGPDGEYSYGFMFEMEITPDGAEESRKDFYMYTPSDGDVWEMNSDYLFDPYSVDQYEPPLHCQEGWYDYYASLDSDESGTSSESDTFGILQGDYYFEGDEGTAHFSFYGSENVDAYYGSGSYETSYTLERLEDEIYTDDDTGETYSYACFEVYNADGGLEFLLDCNLDAPEEIYLYDKDGYFVATYVNINV